MLIYLCFFLSAAMAWPILANSLTHNRRTAFFMWLNKCIKCYPKHWIVTFISYSEHKKQLSTRFRIVEICFFTQIWSNIFKNNLLIVFAEENRFLSKLVQLKFEKKGKFIEREREKTWSFTIKSPFTLFFCGQWLT